MNRKLKLWLLPCLVCCFSQNAFAFFGLDTIYICEGSSVQLTTTPNQLSYEWTPAVNISDPTIYNPIVSPTETTTYFVQLEPNQEENLVTNGDFASGNTSFFSDYIYTPEGTWMQGHYAILTSPTQFNGGFSACQDHSESNDNLMMVVDGAIILDENVWCQVIDVYPDREYNFSSWVTNVIQAAPAILQFSINGELLGDPFTVPGVCEWEEFFATWYSSNYTEAEICITNQNIIAQGNDFALDDIFFTFENTRSVDTFVVMVLPTIETQLDTVICENLSFEYEGIQVPADTVMEFTFENFQGCDSTVIWNVGAIDTFYFETRIDTLCPGDVITYQGISIDRDTQICEIFTGSFGCDSTYCFVAYFLSENTIDMNATLPSCVGDVNGSVLAVPFAGLPPYEYLWEDGTTDPQREGLSAGNYSLTVTDAKGCVAVKPFVLEDPPEISFEAEVIEPSCAGLEDGNITFNIVGGTPGYLLNFNSIGMGEEVYFDGLDSGTYSVLIEDSEGCFLDSIFVLEEPSPIIVGLPNDTLLRLGEIFQINSTISSDLPYTIQWLPNVSVDCATCEDPVFSSYDSQTLEINVTDENGCVTTNAITISIDKSYEVYIPNAFSPNLDGVNEVFEIYTGRDVELIETFRIYNRWGALMYEGLNCFPEDATCQWDGYFKGKKMDPGIYVYYAEVRFLDGFTKLFEGSVFLAK